MSGSAVVRRGHTVGEPIRLSAEKHTGTGVTGTAADVADVLDDRSETRAADGFILTLPTLPASLRDVVALVVPELGRRGLFREGYERRTPREHLGVPRPRTRWAW